MMLNLHRPKHDDFFTLLVSNSVKSIDQRQIVRLLKQRESWRGWRYAAD